MWLLLGSNSQLGTSKEGQELGLLWLELGFKGTCFLPVGTCFTGQLTSCRKRQEEVGPTEAADVLHVAPSFCLPCVFYGRLWQAAPLRRQNFDHSQNSEMAFLNGKTKNKSRLVLYLQEKHLEMVNIWTICQSWAPWRKLSGRFNTMCKKQTSPFWASPTSVCVGKSSCTDSLFH